jgi:hypothetical protein
VKTFNVRVDDPGREALWHVVYADSDNEARSLFRAAYPKATVISTECVGDAPEDEKLPRVTGHMHWIDKLPDDDA